MMHICLGKRWGTTIANLNIKLLQLFPGPNSAPSTPMKLYKVTVVELEGCEGQPNSGAFCLVVSFGSMCKRDLEGFLD